MTEVRTDVPSERAFLGLMLDRPEVTRLRTLVVPEDFWWPKHAHIWRAMTRVAEAGGVVGLPTVQAELNILDKSNDPTYLLELLHDAPLGAEPSWYAQRIADEAGFRRLDEAGARVIDYAASRDLALSDAHELARTAILDVVTTGRSGTHVRVSEVLPEVLEIADGGAAPALSTPWSDLDRLITGLAPGRFVVVGARPGVGKSVMGTNLALHFAEQHRHHVLIASLEMGRTEVTQRLVSARARVNLTGLSSGNLSDAQWDAVRRHHAVIEALPIHIDDTATQTVSHIHEAARDVARFSSDDLALVVVDYLQLLAANAGAGRRNRVEELGEISRGLKVMARDTGACVVAMAAVNREGLRNGDGRPKMSDLRESGSIEADADQVLLLHRPDEQIPDLEVLVDKNRWGPKGKTTLQMRGHYAQIIGADWSPTKGMAS